MGKPLSLYQETGWGVPAIDGGPKSWRELMTGFYLPANVRGGQTVGFLWSNGERTTVLETTYSGVVLQAPGDRATTLGLLVSGGGFLPLVKDSGNLSCIVSGAVIKYELEPISFFPKLSGAVSGIQFNGTFFQFQYGTQTITGVSRGVCDYTVVTSGAISGISQDACSLSIVLEGGFIGLTKDTLDSISMTLTSIVYDADEIVEYEVTAEDIDATISFEFYGIEYKTA